MDISPPVATIRAMDFDTLKSIIEAHRDELRELGVRRVRVFGSVARGEATETSDVDLIVDTIEGTSLFRWGDIHNHLTDWIGSRVDIVEPESVAGRLASEVWSDARDVAQID
jgi:predicted nucleotidyltransferase